MITRNAGGAAAVACRSMQPEALELPAAQLRLPTYLHEPVHRHLHVLEHGWGSRGGLCAALIPTRCLADCQLAAPCWHAACWQALCGCRLGEVACQHGGSGKVRVWLRRYGCLSRCQRQKGGAGCTQQWLMSPSPRLLAGLGLPAPRCNVTNVPTCRGTCQHSIYGKA